MSTKRRIYSSEFKVKVVLELLANELTLAELASKHNVTTKNIQNWKKIFLANAAIAMEPSKAAKDYKAENDKLQQEVDDYAKKVGQYLSEPCKEHVKYSYKLGGVNICRVNQVWSTDITYIKLKSGMVYLAAIIDWHSKAVLSWGISNTMDSSLVMSVLHEALGRFGHPEIFNTDQGSQYTAHIHTEALSSRGITISMDGKGRATDNICIERFWRSAKCERIYLNEYDSLPELRADVADYIDFYNHRRFHESLGYKKPMNVYKEAHYRTPKYSSFSFSVRLRLNISLNDASIFLGFSNISLMALAIISIPALTIEHWA